MGKKSKGKNALAAVQKNAPTSVASPASWLLNAVGGGLPSATGIPVTPATAVQCAAVYACVRLISEDLAKLPLRVYRVRADGSRVLAGNHYLTKVLRRPNNWMTGFSCRETLQWNACLAGNAYAFVDWGDAGRVRRIIPISTNYARIMVDQDGEPFLFVTDPRLGSNLALARGEYLHIHGPSVDGYVGLNPIQLGREAIGLALGTERHGGKLFANGAQVGGILEAPAELSDDAYGRMEKSWMRNYSGADRAHRVAILEGGTKFTKVGMTAEDSQFLQTRGYQTREIARLFRVPPHKIGDLDKATFSNIEQQNIEYVTDCLQSWGGRWADELSSALLLPEDRDYFEIDLDYDELLKADMKTRYDANASALNAGWKTVNEVRKGEGLPPVPGGDVLRQPLNTAPIVDQPGEGPGAGHNGGPALDDDTEEDARPEKDEDDEIDAD
jgi:HK97 family phage portal protein